MLGRIGLVLDQSGNVLGSDGRRLPGGGPVDGDDGMRGVVLGLSSGWENVSEEKFDSVDVAVDAGVDESTSEALDVFGFDSVEHDAFGPTLDFTELLLILSGGSGFLGEGRIGVRFKGAFDHRRLLREYVDSDSIRDARCGDCWVLPAE